MQDKVLVLDFGSSYGSAIVRQVRDLGVYSELVEHTITAKEISKDKAIKAIIFSGSPKSVYAADGYGVDQEIYKLGLPIMGICYGMQLLAHDLGGETKRAAIAEAGEVEVLILQDNVLVYGLDSSVFYMEHNDEVVSIPPGFTNCAKTKDCPHAMMINEDKKFYGVQFHPEVSNKENGNVIFSNFLFTICNFAKSWNMTSYAKQQIEWIKNEVQDDKVLCALSGGVDSTVVASLLHRAIGENLTCMFVDHGLLRKNEADTVMETFRNNLNLNVIKVDAKEHFLTKLKAVVDPEEKRKIIGCEFINVFEKETKKLSGINYLAQGTIYPDILESGTEKTKLVKSHHNVGGLPKKLNFKLIEPIKYLYKEEVRKLGAELDIPKALLSRQPFPGPGLGVRCLGEVTEEKLAILRQADAIVTEEIEKANITEAWQYFAVLPNLLSVGVKENERSYLHTIAIRVISTKDAVRADWVKIPYEVLERISSRITREVLGVNRVVYDITSKPPATIEWE